MSCINHTYYPTKLIYFRNDWGAIWVFKCSECEKSVCFDGYIVEGVSWEHLVETLQIAIREVINFV